MGKPSNLQVLHPHLVPGVRVLISGLSDRTELNGQQGEMCVSFCGSQRLYLRTKAASKKSKEILYSSSSQQTTMVEADLCLFFDDFSSSPLPIIGFQWAIFGKTHFVLSC